MTAVTTKCDNLGEELSHGKLKWWICIVFEIYFSFIYKNFDKT